MSTPTVQGLRHLKNVGVFADVAVGSFPHTFKPYNLVYGFNGCGKTTLSRLIESLGDEGLNPNLSDGAEFSFLLSDGTAPSQINLANAASRFVAVFSEDYIENTLTWKEGTARPIIYLGKEQAELAQQLTSLEAQEATAVPEEVLRSSEWSSAQRGLETKCRNVARLIAEELNLGRRYNAANLRGDYQARRYAPADKLSDDERKRLKEVINRSDLPNRLNELTCPAGGDAAHELVGKALISQVREIAIAALQRRKDALGWVEEGIRLHAEEQACLFCGNVLLGSRMDELEQALQAGFDTFAAELAAAADEAERFRESCRRHKDLLASPSETLPTFSAEMASAKRELANDLDRAIEVANQWLQALARKRSNPDETPVPSKLGDGVWDSQMRDRCEQANRIVAANNDALDNFSSEQQVARDKLKGHHLADHQSGYDEAGALETRTRAALQVASSTLADLRTQIGELRAQLRSHGPAAAELKSAVKELSRTLLYYFRGRGGGLQNM